MKGIKEILVETNNGLDDCLIELVQDIERDVDRAMVKNGFSRVASSKSDDSLTFTYRQFAKALPREVENRKEK